LLDQPVQLRRRDLPLAGGVGVLDQLQQGRDFERFVTGTRT
jgi:hypothetical protein